MLKRVLGFICFAGLILGTVGCHSVDVPIKLGVSIGSGGAARWVSEQKYMEERAQQLGAEIEVRINTAESSQNQLEDCKELIDLGIDVLILTPKDAELAVEIVAYAKEHKVPVLNYSRVVFGAPVDLYVGYDSGRIGQRMGQYLAEAVYQGDYILLQGDEADNNAKLLNEGAMRYIDPIRQDINIILNAPVPTWSKATAKEMVKAAVQANGNRIDAILAPNDQLAEGCAEALTELGITKHVVITGMDAELAAVQRIVAGTQDMTFYLDLKELAQTAVDQACLMAKGKDTIVNAEFDNKSSSPVPANLLVGQIVTKENLDKILIDSGYFTKEQVYGTTTEQAAE